MTGTRTVAKAADVLLCFSPERPVWRLSEISRTLGLSKTVVHRLLRTLHDKGFVARNPTDGTFSPGGAGLQLAAAFMRGGDLIAKSQAAMQELWRALEETVALSIRVADHRVCISQLESPQALRYTLPVGHAMSFYGGATGKVFLAEMADAHVADYLRRVPGWRVAPRTIVTPQAMWREIRRIRGRGHATGFDEGSPGGAGVAAPIRGLDGRLVGVLTVLGPTSRLPRVRLRALAPRVIVAADTISVRMGHLGQKKNPEASTGGNA